MNASIVIHPAYLPSIAQMAAIAQAEQVVLENHDNYQKQTYRNRAYVAHSNGVLLLNVPVKHVGKGIRQQYKDIRTENEFPWISQHWKSIQTAYRTSPFFEYYEDDIAPIFEREVTSLFEHNIFIQNTIIDLIGIEVSFSNTDEYHKEITDKTDYRSLINHKGSKTFTFPKYHQVFQEPNDFLSNLSVLDLLFNEGPNSLEYLENLTL